MIDGELRIERGDLDDQQVVALVTSLIALRATDAPVAPQASGGQDEHISLWSKRSRLIRPTVRPGPGAWRASMMPR